MIQTLIDYEYACVLNEQGYFVKGHIKIDTGMHRLGFDCVDIEKIKNTFSMKHIKVCGIFTHLCVSDSLAETEQNYSRIAILPIGYADGFPRKLSCGKSYVLISGQKVPVVGRICMDQLAVIGSNSGEGI